MLFNKFSGLMNLLRPLSPHLKSTFRRLIILTPVLLCLSFCFDWLGFSFLKIQSALWQTGLRALFRLVGWECLGPVMILLCLVSGLGGYTLHMQDPAGGQPAANPAAEQPSNVPSGASTSGWRSFEERVLLESMPSSNESSEASVNQEPAIPQLDPPLMEENARRAELSDRLRMNWWGIAYNEQILDSFLHHQLSIDRHVEAALVEDGCSPQVVFERRHQIRGFLFYPEGRALGEDTYAGYLTQILKNGTRQSIPYRRVIKAIRNSDLLL